MNNSWIFDIENIIFTKVKKVVSDELSGKYPKLKFTTTDNASGSPTFPCVYIHELPGVERGGDLENKSINAVLYTMQIDVFANSSQEDAKRVMRSVVLAFKELGFTIYQMPEFKNESSIYRQVVRVRRLIGNGDSL